MINEKHLIIAFLAGAAIVALPPYLSNRIGATVSQSIYDCGIRVAAEGATVRITGAVVEGHRYGICFN